MSHVVDLKSRNPLLGTWRSCDPFEENVSFTISAEGEVLTVSGIDSSDGERPEVFGITWSQESKILEFSAHWQSTGRLTKYRFSASPSGDRTEVSYTYTVQQIWERM